MILKPFIAADAEDAAALHIATFPDPWPAQAFVTLLNTGATGFAMRAEGVLAGLILYRVAADEAEILTFAVRSALRRNGIGLALLLQAVAALKAAAIERFLLEVAKDNTAALSLYRQVGFEIVGARAGYYTLGEQHQDAWVMLKHLL